MTVIVIEFFFNVIVIDIILCNWTQPWQPSSGILGQQVLPLLASCLGKQAIPCVTQSISTLISIHDLSCLSDPYGLLDSCCVFVTLSVNHFCPFQSMMQLFLSAWSVIADLCSITVDTLFCYLVNHLVVMLSTSFLCSPSLVPNVLHFATYRSYKGSGIYSLTFYCLPLCPLDALVFS